MIIRVMSGTGRTTFGTILRQLREARGLTQERLAELVSVQRITVIRWESDEREPGWSTIQALADALGVTCEAFREQKEPPGEDES